MLPTMEHYPLVALRCARLDRGRGSLIDLPQMPRRFLEEGRVLYCHRKELELFEARVDRAGRLVWGADGEQFECMLPSL